MCLRKIVPLDSLETCAICREPMYKNLYTFECEHVFHSHCALRWLDKSQTCPLCRRDESRQSIVAGVLAYLS